MIPQMSLKIHWKGLSRGNPMKVARSVEHHTYAVTTRTLNTQCPFTAMNAMFGM